MEIPGPCLKLPNFAESEGRRHTADGSLAPASHIPAISCEVKACGALMWLQCVRATSYILEPQCTSER